MIVVNLDVMMARRKVSAGELAERVGITPANLSIFKNNKAKAVLYALTRTLACFFLIALLPAAFEMLRIYAPARSTGTRLPLWVLYASYPVGSIAMILGYLRITPGRVKALWNNTVEKTEFEKINEGEVAE